MSTFRTVAAYSQYPFSLLQNFVEKPHLTHMGPQTCMVTAQSNIAVAQKTFMLSQTSVVAAQTTFKIAQSLLTIAQKIFIVAQTSLKTTQSSHN